MLNQLLTQRQLLPIDRMNNGAPCTRTLWPLRRRELLDNLQHNIYGYTPDLPRSVTGDVVWENDIAYAGKALHQRIHLRIRLPHAEYHLPFHLLVPHRAAPRPPLLLHLAFRPSFAAMQGHSDYYSFGDSYLPIEEFLDQGDFALAIVCYTDIIPDSIDGNYTAGLGRHLFTSNRREPAQWGKIGIWAYGASCVLDYLMQHPTLDTARISVMGHSRLGKTALWMGAQDERLYAVISNNSGFGGAAIAKKGSGERIADFIRAGSWDWYCENFKRYLGREDEQPYDQHMLLAAIAPRRIFVASAALDRGADPRSEFLSCLAASRAYALNDLPGLITPDRLPEEPLTELLEGRIGYYLRSGHHFLSRQDWLTTLRYLRQTEMEN